MARCIHGNCHCVAADGSEYCSSYCENVHKGEALPGYGDFEGNCACGHVDCALRHAVSHALEETKASIGWR